MVAVKQVPGKRDCHSSQKAPDGCKGQHFGSGEVRDKIPVDFGKAGMSRRGDRAVLTSLAEPGVEWPVQAAPGTSRWGNPLPTQP